MKSETRTIAFWADDQVRSVKVKQWIDDGIKYGTVEFDDVNDFLFYLLAGAPDPFKVV